MPTYRPITYHHDICLGCGRNLGLIWARGLKIRSPFVTCPSWGKNVTITHLCEWEELRWAERVNHFWVRFIFSAVVGLATALVSGCLVLAIYEQIGRKAEAGDKMLASLA